MQGNYRYELPQLQLKSFLTECRELNDDGDVNENGKKAKGLDWQNNSSARASLFCTFLCRHYTTTT